MTERESEAGYPDPWRSWIRVAPVRFVAILVVVLGVYRLSLYFVDFDLVCLWGSLPRLAHRAAKAIARALAQRSRLVLTDEPVASLDPEAAKSVLMILQEIAHERMIAVLVSLHQVEFAMQFTDRVIGVQAGRIIADRPAALLAEIDRRTIFAT